MRDSKFEKKREKKKRKINSRLRGSFDRPCVTIFKSNTSIYCNLIDRKNNNVLASVSSRSLFKDSKNCNIEKATETGKKMGEKIKELKFDSIIFNRNGYLYHGKVKALADGIRNCGIKF